MHNKIVRLGISNVDIMISIHFIAFSALKAKKYKLTYKFYLHKEQTNLKKRYAWWGISPFMCCAIAESDARGYFMNFTALVEPSV